MRLRRLYADGQVSGVIVQDAPARQNFSPSLIEQGAVQGWIGMGLGQITIHGQDDDVIYKIERTPGYYCCHCQKDVGDGPGGQEHVAAEHPGVASPDAGNPGGYRKDNFYAGVKV